MKSGEVKFRMVLTMGARQVDIDAQPENQQQIARLAIAQALAGESERDDIEYSASCSRGRRYRCGAKLL